MAEAFRFEREKSPKIVEPEYAQGLEFREEEESQGNSSSWKSSPIFPSHGDICSIRTSREDRPETLDHEVPTEEYDEGEIIASAEKEESPQKNTFTFIQPKQDETLTNFLDEVERGNSFELVSLPPASAVSIQGMGMRYVMRCNAEAGTSSSKVAEIPFKPSKEFHDPEESLESPSRLSRIESAKHDMKNLKSATLGRMGKMFKIRPPTPSGHEKNDNQTEQGVDAAATAEQQYGQDPTRKEKTHSLGRMLRLVDKDGAPRKLFSHTRAGSLTRLRKMRSTVGNVAGSSEESRNIFSRLINQFRSGRNSSPTNAEPNLQSINVEENSPKPSLGTRLMMSLSARGNSTSGGGTAVDITAIEPSVEQVSAIEYTA